ncbi:diguanylate cyclase [Roseiflexus sp.]|uniref:diguanylate cyclase n=3 Tax=Roseiflexus sp. TaxID=2562120 RepID=UPI00398A6B31
MYFLVEGDQQFTLLSIAVGATSEAVLITDTAGKILFLNRQFEELWHLTPGWMETITQHDRIWDLAYQVIDPEQFLSRIDGLYAHPDLEVIDWLILHDGRIIERYTRGLRIGDCNEGRLWLFRDITSRERAQRELTVMKSVLEALNRIVEPQRQLQAGVQALAQELGARAAWLWGVEGGDFARLLAHDGTRELHIDLMPRAPGDPCECLQRLLDHAFPSMAHPIVCPRLAHLTTADQEPVRHISVPIYSRDRPLAILNLVLPSIQPFNVTELRMFAAIANQFSVAIERAHLFDSVREEQRAAEVLRQASATLSALLDFEQVLDHVLDQIVALMPCDGASVMLVEGTQARVVRVHGYERLGDESGQMIRQVTFEIPRTPTLRRMLQTRQPWIISETLNNPAWVQIEDAAPIRSWLGAPVIVRQQVVAFICVDSFTPYAYRPEHERRLATLASGVSLALQNAQLYTQTHDALERERRLVDVMRVISSALDIDVILSTVARLSMELVGADAVALGLLSSDHRSVSNVHTLNVTDELMAFQQGVGPVWHVVETRQSIIRHNLVLTRSGARDAYSIPSALGLPIVAGNQISGIMAIYHLRTRRHFTEHDRAVLDIVSRQAGIALANAQLFAKTQRLATTDHLTGLFNRHHFFALAPRELERARRYHHTIALLIIDIDHFKIINDTYGHHAGDTVLRSVADRMRRELRDADILARFGGEEFIALLPETNLAGALHVAERLRAAIASLSIIFKDVTIPVTISIGCAASDRLGEDERLDTLIQCADRALYTAKSNGRNQVAADP